MNKIKTKPTNDITFEELAYLRDYHIQFNALPLSVQQAIALEELKKRGFIE